MKLELCELGPEAFGLESISPFCLKVHRTLKFYGLKYERRHALRPSDHKQFNPTGQAPVLLIDGKPVPDSTEIIKALEPLVSKSLVPEDRRQRAEAWFWEDYADQVLGNYAFAARWFDDRNWEALSEEQFRPMPGYLKPWMPNRARKRLLDRMSRMEIIRVGQDACWRGFQEHLDMLEDRAPETGFWMGDEMTVADIGLFAVLHALRTELSRWPMDEINRHPRLCAWLDRVDAQTQ